MKKNSFLLECGLESNMTSLESPCSGDAFDLAAVAFGFGFNFLGAALGDPALSPRSSDEREALTFRSADCFGVAFDLAVAGEGLEPEGLSFSPGNSDNCF